MSLTKEQIEQRKSLLTASDVPAVLDVNPFHSPLDVWLEKRTEGGSADTWRTKRGHLMEPLILEAVAASRGVQMQRESITHVHVSLPWLGATPDAIVLHQGQPIAVAEGKEVGMRMAHHWTDPETGDDRVPDYVIIQAQVQITVCRTKFPGIDRAFVGSWLPDEEEPRIAEIMHEPDLERAILAGAGRFWKEHMLTGNPPEAKSPEERIAIARALFPFPTKGVRIASDAELELLATQFLAARETKKTAEAEMDEIAARMCMRIGNAEGVDGTGWRALWSMRGATTVKEHVRKAGRTFDLREIGKKKKANQESEAAE